MGLYALKIYYESKQSENVKRRGRWRENSKRKYRRDCKQVVVVGRGGLHEYES